MRVSYDICKPASCISTTFTDFSLELPLNPPPSPPTNLIQFDPITNPAPLHQESRLLPFSNKGCFLYPSPTAISWVNGIYTMTKHGYIMYMVRRLIDSVEYMLSCTPSTQDCFPIGIKFLL